MRKYPSKIPTMKLWRVFEMGILLRQFSVENIYYVGTATLKWVDKPFDITEKTPRVIGIIGTNGSGKSTMLSRAFAWLAHPESNDLGFHGREIDETVFFDPNIARMTAKAVFEFEGRIYEAERSLLGGSSFGHRDYRLHRYVDKDGSKEPITSEKAWNRIFGPDPRNYQAYLCEHHNLAKMARKMASPSGLRGFSDHIGHHHVLESLGRLKSIITTSLESAEGEKLTGAELNQYNEYN